MSYNSPWKALSGNVLKKLVFLDVILLETEKPTHIKHIVPSLLHSPLFCPSFLTHLVSPAGANRELCVPSVWCHSLPLPAASSLRLVAVSHW